MSMKFFSILLLIAAVVGSKNRSANFVNFHTFNETCTGESDFCNDGDRGRVFNETDDVFASDGLQSDVNIVEMWNDFPKILVPVNSENAECRKDSAEFMRGLNKTELWALRMFDSTAKLPSGMLNGNIKQFGDFDQCLGIVSPARRGPGSTIRGKYCLAELDIRLNKAMYKELDSLIHARDFMTSAMDDNPTIFPRFTTIDWAVCMPASCSAQDLEEEMRKAFKGAALAIRVQEEQCSRETESEEFDSSPGKIFTIAFFGTIFVLVVLGTLIDDQEEIDEDEPVWKRVLIAFSFQRNFDRVFRPPATTNNVKAVNGVRCINTLCVLYVHKAIALLHHPYSNRTYMAESFGKPWTVVGRTGMYHTDSFLLMSGLLNAHALTGDLMSRGNIPYTNRVVGRIFRILPNLLAIMLFCTYIMPDLDSGPQWNLLIRQHAELCKENMWKNVLFIQNYMGFNNICLTHTHQLGTDMQLFLATPPVVWAIWRWPRRALTLAVIAATLSTVLRYVVTLQYRLAPMTYFGMPNSKFSETSDLSYTLPDHRATPYLIGVILGYLIKKGFNKLNMTKGQVRCCWLVAVVAMLLPMLGPYRIADPHYVYSPHDAAMFSAFAPLTFGAFIAWTIVAANCGVAGGFGRFLEWRCFRILTNISYGIYLTQFPVFFYNIGRIRTPDYFSVGSLINIPELLRIALASSMLAVFVEYPFLEIRKIIFDNVKKKTRSSKIEDKVINSKQIGNLLKDDEHYVIGKNEKVL